MKLKKSFITHSTGKEHIMVSTGREQFTGLVRSNKTAAFIIECLKEDITAKEIKNRLFEKYDAPMEQISADVDQVLAKLLSINAIDE